MENFQESEVEISYGKTESKERWIYKGKSGIKVWEKINGGLRWGWMWELWV